MLFSKKAAVRAAVLSSGFAWTLVSSNAFAGPGEPGWYVGVDAFATHPNSANADSAGQVGSNGVVPTAGSSCLLDLGLGTVSPLGICILGPSTAATPGSPAIPGIPAQSFSYDFKWGYGGGATFGYAFENGLRPELDFNYSHADVDKVTFGAGFGTTTGAAAGSQDIGGHLQTLRIMANAWYDLDLGKVAPYIGGGIGAQQTKTTVPSLVDGSDTTFAFQLGAGVGFLLSDNVTLSVDYRYVDADKPKYNNQSTNQPLTSEYQSHNVGLSLRYAFGENGGRDSDGDGVPDRLDECPNTPKGVTVYSNGCPTDMDNDGVPDYLDKCPNTPIGAPVNADGCPIDSDGDGVPDNLDQCPGTPPGVAVDTHGCPLDSDGDGVPDYLDKCPNTPKGTKVDANGCEYIDSDGDGVPDYMDKCPNTPHGQHVGPDGCPLDSDGDGIPDDLDECPNTPRGLKVLPDGCAPVGDCRRPRPGEKIDERGCAVDRRFVLRGVKFEFDSDRLTKPAQDILNDVAQTLGGYPKIRLDVEGHTDSRGTDAYNLGLSERRANSVIRYLATRGVETSRLKAIGYGESMPIDTNETDAGRENNRRVEFKVTSDE